jgi:IclR family pca regulon transcriptional regulator
MYPSTSRISTHDHADGAPAPGDAYVQSFARGIAVMRSFGAQYPRQTMSQVAQRTGLTRAGARRILLTLQQLGYVRCDGRWFELTAKVLDLGFAYLSSLDLWHLAEPLMQEFAREVGESCSAAILDGHDIVYVLRVASHKIMSLNLGVGSRLPAWCSSMGRVLLAGLGDDEVARLLAQARPLARTPRTVHQPDALLEIVRTVRQQGWALVDEELEEGLISLAVPIRARDGRVLAAINVSGQAHRTPRAVMLDAMLPRLRRTAGVIEQLLASRSGPGA